MNKITLDKKQNVVIKALSFDKHKYIDGVKLYKLQKIINKKYFNINPELMNNNKTLKNTSKYLSGYIPIKSITEKDINQIYEILKKIHKIKLNVKNSPWTFKSLYNFFDLYINNKFNDYEKYKYLLNSKYFSKKKQFLCHSDLHFNNILKNKNGNIIILDFDFLCVNDYYYDIASLISENDLSFDTIQYILKKWKLKDIDKLYFYIKLEKLINSMWSNYLYEISKENKKIYKDISIKKYNQLKNA